jgi:CCR4-NOT transcriptional regulation complex NOT5 subunit
MQMATEQQRQQALGRLDIGTTKKTASSIQEAMQDAEQTISTIKMGTLSRKKTFTKQTSTPIMEAIG